MTPTAYMYKHVRMVKLGEGLGSCGPSLPATSGNAKNKCIDTKTVKHKLYSVLSKIKTIPANRVHTPHPSSDG